MTEPEKGLPRGWLIFEPCPKCGAGVPRLDYIYQTAGCSVWPHTRHSIDEHFHAHCWRCGFDWEARMNGMRA